MFKTLLMAGAMGLALSGCEAMVATHYINSFARCLDTNPAPIGATQRAVMASCLGQPETLASSTSANGSVDVMVWQSKHNYSQTAYMSYYVTFVNGTVVRATLN